MNVGRLWARMQNLVAFGQTTDVVDDSGATPTVQAQLTALETHPGLQVIHHFGFSSSAPKGSRIAALFGAGDRSKGIILGTVDGGSRYRNLGSGESVQFNLYGMSLLMGQNGITINAGGKPVTVTNGSKARFEMPIESTAEVTAQCDGAFVHLSTHQTTNVQSGGGLSGPPKPNT